MINYKEKYKICGALPSPKDDRDYPINMLIAKAPKLPHYFRTNVGQPILDQGNVGCCVAETLVTIKWIQEHMQNNTEDRYSAMMIYGNRDITKDYVGSGMHPREALKHLKDTGVCKEEYYDGLFEYEEAINKYYSNKTSLDAHAYPYRISSYYRLNSKLDIMQALVTTGCVQVCIPVYESLYFPDKNGNVKYVEGQENFGGHSVSCIGYDIDNHVWIIQNSWGESYGDNGVIYLDMDYPITEAWAIVDEITEQDIIEKYKE